MLVGVVRVEAVENVAVLDVFERDEMGGDDAGVL